MPTITVRLSDSVRDGLQAKADEANQSLSDFVRDRLEDAVFAFQDEGDRAKGLEPASLSVMDRRTLSLLHRILGRVLPPDANDVDGDLKYQLERAKVLEEGFTQEYWVEFAGVRPELALRHCEFVENVLEMFRIALYSMNELRKEEIDISDELQHRLTFDGFDHNHSLEGQMSEYVTFLVQDDKWTEQRNFVLGPDHGNSHHQTIDTYSRMLTEYRGVKQSRPRRTGRKSYLLSKEELERIAEARVHPSNR